MSKRLLFKTTDGKFIELQKAAKPEDKVHKVMSEFKAGTLKSSSGQKVTSRDQAIAIAMSESGLSKNMVADILIDYDDMEKARITKYIKRLPHPSGKGFIYFYTQEQIKAYKTNGVLPGEEKKKSLFSNIMSFFSLKNEEQAEQKAKKDYEESNVKEKLNLTFTEWANHLNEYLKNKTKWDELILKKLQAQKDVQNTKTGTEERKKELSKEFKAEKNVSETAKKSGFNFKVMYYIFNFYKKQEMIKEHETIQDTRDESNIRQYPISAIDDAVHSGGTEGRSLSNVPERQPTDNTGDNGIAGGLPGERSGRDVRLTKTQIKNTRQAILDLLASKTNEEMTEEDKALLRQYEGAGGIDEKDKSIHGTLYEYYTPRNVVSKMWALVEKYVGTGRKEVLEPSAGIGRFAENKDHDFTMFELDETSARINSILFPDADIANKAFQEMFMKGGVSQKEYKGKKFQIAIGNPPYGEYTGFHKGLGEGKIHTTYQEYFIDRGLDTLEDGGIMAYIVPSGFLRGNKYSEAKSAISKKGKLLEAYRLPNGTFSTTGVGTDILIIRKEQGNIDDFLDDQYFKNNPEKILGEQTTIIGRFGPEQFVKLKAGDTFDNVISNIDVNATPPVSKGAAPQKEQVLKKTKITFEKKQKTEKQKSENNFETMPDVETETIESFNKKYNKKFNAEELEIWKATDSDGYISSQKLSAKDKKYLETSNDICIENGKYVHKTNYASGNIYKKLDELELNKDKLSTEKYRIQKQILTEALPEYKTVNNFVISPISDFAKNFKFETDEEGGAGQNIVDRFMDWAYGSDRHHYMEWTGGVSRHDIPAGISWSDILDYISQKPVSADKKAEAEDKDFSRAKKVELRRDISEKLFKRFLENGLNINEQRQIEDRYNKQFNSYVAPDYSAIPIFMEGMSKSFKGKDLIVKEKQMQGVSFLCNKGNGLLAYDVGVGKTLVGILATINQLQTGRAKKPVICVPKAVYKNWIKEIRDLFPDIKINDLGNLGTQFAKNAANIEEGSLSVMTYEALGNMTFKDETIHGGLIEDMLDSQQMTGEGMSERERAEMKERIMEKLGNAVKSKSIAVSAEEREQGWNILKIVNKEGLKRHNGREIAPSSIKDAYRVFGEDIMVVKEGSLWKTISKSTGLQLREASTKDKVIDDTKATLTKQGEQGFKTAIKNAIDARGVINAENNFETMPDDEDAVKSGAFFFEDLGFDHITVDEVHNFKNIFGQAKPQKNVGNDGKEKQTANEFQGLTGSSSDRGLKMFALTQVIQQKNNDRNIFALSATPFTNSPLEIYNILSLVARKRLKELGIYNLHEFMAQFAKLKSEWAIKSDGKIERKSVMKEFQNLSALQSLIREYIDKIDGEEAGIIRPNKNTQLVQLEMSQIQKKIYAIETERFDQRGDDGRPVPGAVLKAINNMRMATVSPHLIHMEGDEMYEGSGLKELIAQEDIVEDSPKLKFVFDCAANLYSDNKEKGQVIYMPRGTKQYSKMVDNLVKKGVPKDAIATMDSSTSPDKKEAIMASFNDPEGKIKIIIGSETIKEGVNLNGNSAVLYNTLLGWNPAETTQVEGRIWRQGNKQGQVHIVYPQLVDSVDAAMYQKHDEKSERFKALWSFKGDNLNVEDINPEELKFEIIKDPEKRAKFQMDLKTEELDNQVREKRIFIDGLAKYQSDLSSEQDKIEEAKKNIPKYQEDVAEAEKVVEDIEKELKDYKISTSKKDPGYEREIDMFDRKIRGAKDRLQSEKRYVREEEKKIKFAEQNVETILSRLNGMGLAPENIGARIASEENNINAIDEEIKHIKDSKQEFIDRAKAEIAASRKTVPSLSQTTKDVLDLIRGNMQPMEEVLKTMKKAVSILFKKVFNPEKGKYDYYRISMSGMEKARVTKYIKRIPNPKGKGYIYFYTKEQVKDFQEKGKLPDENKGKKEEKTRSGILGAWSAMANFFGITGGRNSDETKFREKIQEEYSKHKKELKESGADVSTFAQHLNEFLSNKEKWLKKLSGDKKEKPEAKPKSEAPKSEKTEKKESTGQKWNMSVMRTIAGIYGGGEKKDSESGIISRSQLKEHAEKIGDGKGGVKSDTITVYQLSKNKDGSVSFTGSKKIDSSELNSDKFKEDGDYLWTTRKPEDSDKSSDGKIKDWQKYRESPDNFETMPEGENKPPEGMLKPRLIGKFSNQKNIVPAKVGTKFNLDEEKFLLQLPNVEKNYKGQIVIYIKNNKDLNFLDKINWNKTKDTIKREQKESDRQQRGIDKEKEEQELFNNNKKISSKIDEVFGTEEYTINSANKVELIKFLNGTNKKFKGVVNRNWEEPLEKMGALSKEDEKGSRQIDWNKIKEYFNTKPSATEALKEIERTERFPEVPTYAEVPEGFKIIEGTTALKGYEFYRNGTPLKEGYKKILVKNAPKDKPSATEALKEELRKKPSSREEKSKPKSEPQNWEKTDLDIKELKTQSGKNIDPRNIKGSFKVWGEDLIIIKDGKSWDVIEKKTGAGIRMGSSSQKDAIENAKDVLNKYGEKTFKESIANLKQVNDSGNDEKEKQDNPIKTDLLKNIGKFHYDKSEYASVNKYVNNMVKDLIENTPEHSFKYNIDKGADVEDLIKKQIKGYEAYAEKLSGNIKDKNYKELTSVLHTGNTSSRRIFEEITGVNLGSTNKSMEDAVAKFVGEDKVKSIKDEEKSAQEAKSKAEKDKKEAEDKKKYEILGSWGDTLSAKEKGLAVKQLEKQFRSPTGKIRTAKDIVDEKISEGWKVFKDEDGKERFMHPDGRQSMGGTMGNATINKYAIHRAKEKSGEKPLTKALSNLKEELMFKAATTKYIKRIPDPKGKGWIYFYTPEQVKAYTEKGILPNQQKKPEAEVKKEGKGNIEILKESVKKVASILADALSARDAVQPTGSAVEQTGENVAAKSKDKKRLEENKKKADTKPVNKPNKPEEKLNK